MYLLRTKFKGEIISEFLPPAKPSNKVMIFCTGMPGYPSKSQILCEFFSKKGYWCFVPRYRGSWESGGKMFAKSPHLDILDIINELSKGFTEFYGGKNFKINNPEVYLVCSSFGGPAGILLSKDSRVKKVICFSPVLDWREEKDSSEPISELSKFIEKGFGFGYRIAKGGWKKIEKGEMYNPATELEKIDGKKVLIFHAKDDGVVSLKAVIPFKKASGVELKLYARGGHLGMAILEKRFHKLCMKFLKKR